MSNISEESQLIAIWSKIYKKYFNLEIDASGIKYISDRDTIFIDNRVTGTMTYDALPFQKGVYEISEYDYPGDEYHRDLLYSNDVKPIVSFRSQSGDYCKYPKSFMINYVIDENLLLKEYNNKNMRYPYGSGKLTLLEYLLLKLYHFEKYTRVPDNEVFICNDYYNSKSRTVKVGFKDGIFFICISEHNQSHNRVWLGG